MNKDRKKTGLERKIIFFSPEEYRKDDESDGDLTKESEEKELNEHPKVAGRIAPKELYEKIVVQLKQMGVWEEEPDGGQEGAGEKASDGTGSTEAEEGMSGGAGQALLKAGLSGSIGPAESEEKLPGGTGLSESEEKLSGGTGLSESKEKLSGGTGLSESKEKLSGGTGLSESEEKLSGGTGLVLSEEDLRALELGREILRKREQKKNSFRKRRIRKNCGIVAAALVLVFGVAMTSEANRAFAVKMWELAKAGLGFRFSHIRTGEEQEVYVASDIERADKEKIQKILDIYPVDFGYFPEGIRYLQCDIQENNQIAALLYGEDERITIIEGKDSLNVKQYYVFDEEPILQDTVITDQEILVEIWKADQKNGEKEVYIATWQYEDCKYIMEGVISLKKIKKIAENIIISN